ncbi:MAG: beta-N-acetylglucosaminidase domain-containing protein [Clostridia bacterium]|nr:beta-N-acetylglucosaminidase domain-containing protein [Clostridia bacterium]
MKKYVTILTAAALVCSLLLSACTPDDIPVTDTDTDAGTVTETDAGTDTETERIYTDELHVSVYPRPQSYRVSVRGIDSADASLLSPSTGDYDGVFARFGFSVGEGGLPVAVTVDDSLSDGAYTLKVRSNGIELSASGRSGVFNAVCTLAQLCADGRIAAADVDDGPASALRGVIEGFYGQAWTDEVRLDLFRMMGDNKLNTYIYAPKDDPKHRARWREKYTSKELDRMRTLIDGAKENNVSFVYAISPGIDIDLGAGYEKDLQKLFKKCESIYDLGVRDFAIFLDDIETHDAEGHARLVNDFQSGFIKTHEGCSDLIMITPEFCTAMLSEYTDAIAPLIDPDIVVMWTGTGVIPETIKEKDLKQINKKLGRKVFIWWNYPVNDTMADRLFMGPCEGLEKTLCDSVCGLVSNPMNQGYASFLPLMTVADYLWNPSAYNAERSAEEAAAILAPRCTDGLLAFMDLMRGSMINKDRSSLTISDLINSYGADADSAAKLSAKLEKMKKDLADLKSYGGEKLINEIRPWLEKAEAYVGAATELVAFDTAGDGAEKNERALAYVSEYDKTGESAAIVSRDVLMPMLTSGRSRINSVIRGEEKTAAESAEAFTDCREYDGHSVINIVDGDDRTFFWSAGTLMQASDGGKGYIGIKFAAKTTVRNVYISTGDNGRDALADIIIEYSADNRSWKKLASGRLGDEIFLDGLNISAVSLRVRNGDTSSSNWVIIRTFEANTTRRPASSGKKVATDMPVYLDNKPENAIDGDGATCFWSSAAPVLNSSFTVDLGSASDVTGVRLYMGSDSHADDYIRNGVIEYSADGLEFKQLCRVDCRTTVYDGQIYARYVRVRCTAEQTNWVMISEFEIKRGSTLPQGALFDGDPDTDFSALSDKDLFSVFSPSPEKIAGKTLSLDVSDAASAELYLTETAGVTVYTEDASGAASANVSVSPYTKIDVTGASRLCIRFDGGQAGIAEIVIK